MNHTPSEPVVSHPNCRALGRNLLAGALAFALLGAASTATAETHALIPSVPATAVSAVNKSVAVDPIYHYVYTVSPSNQVQVTYRPNDSMWITGPLGGGGQAVKPLTKLYVDTGYHNVYYIGTNDRIWVWYFDGSQWLNGQLSTEVATDVVGVDSNFHYLWFRNLGQLRCMLFNGSAWIAVSTGVTDFNGFYGTAVDQTSHSFYWVDGGVNGTGGNSLRMVFYTGRVFLDRTLTSDSTPSTRPAVNPTTGEVYADDLDSSPAFRLFRELPSFTFFRQDVGVTSAPFDTHDGFNSIAVNPTGGKVFYNTAAAPGGVAILTPSGPGAGATWTRSFVSGTEGQTVYFCDLDSTNNWYFYTTVEDTLLHIIF
jgi:hypothetical protein